MLTSIPRFPAGCFRWQFKLAGENLKEPAGVEIEKRLWREVYVKFALKGRVVAPLLVSGRDCVYVLNHDRFALVSEFLDDFVGVAVVGIA